MKSFSPRVTYLVLFVIASFASNGLSRQDRNSLYAAESKGTAQLAAAKKKPSASAAGDDEKPADEPAGKMQPIVIARPAEVTEKSMSGAYRFFLGTTHGHSGFSGDHAKAIAEKMNKGVANYDLHPPAECFEKAKNNHYDFYFMTDHSSPEQNEFYKNGFTDEHWAVTKKQAAAATTDQFLALTGYEFSRNSDPDKGGVGHMNVLNCPEWTSAYAKGHTFDWLYDWLAQKSDPLLAAQFNHPAAPGGKGKNFNSYKGRTKERNDVVCLAEIWNSGESMQYVGTVRKMWALGWKVGPTCGCDVHGPIGIENKRLRTGVLAEQLTAESIMKALRARRVYATLEPTLHLEFTLNGVMMGTALDTRPTGELRAKVFINDPGASPLSRIEIVGSKYESNGGESKTLATLDLKERTKTVEANVAAGYDYYYAVVYKQGVQTPRAFAAPIWMDNR